jgi:AcrR family transcriptional regulator
MDGARMQEIADEAGINKALLHYYYRSKQHLFEAVFKGAFLLLAPQLNKVLNEKSSLFDKIKNFTNSYISFVMKHPYLPNFIIQELNRNPEFVKKLVSDKHFPNLENFKQQVDVSVKEGIIKQISAEQLFINIMALNLFPFLASPLIKGFLQISDTDYNDLLESRKTEVANFIIDSLRL